jgi:hypothetical protein
LRRALEEDGGDRLVQSSVTVERFLILTAYIMRMLKDADLLTREITESKPPVTKFPCVVRPGHRELFAISEDAGKTWRQPLEDHYDLAKGNREVLPFYKVCNYFVHHFALTVRYDDATDEIGVFFNSDETTDRLYLIGLRTYVELVEEVAYDETWWVDIDHTREKDPVIRRRQRPPDR